MEALSERQANGRSVRFPAPTAFVAASTVGPFDEVIQTVVPDRVFDPVDIVFNVSAAALAAVALGRVDRSPAVR